jgi:hypothetical protein
VTASRNAFPAYLLGLGTWFVPLGIQMVLFPWLVAVVLHMDAFAVGVAQATAATRAAFCCATTCFTPRRPWRSPPC